MGRVARRLVNNEWKVIALHHYGKNEEEGGVQINEAGDKRAANRGVLICNIMNELGKEICPPKPLPNS